MTNKERFQPVYTKISIIAPISLGTPGLIDPVDYRVFKKSSAEKAKLIRLKAECPKKKKLERVLLINT